jgi:hypothetical protein
MNFSEGSIQAFLFPNRHHLRNFRTLLSSTKKSLKICMYQLTDKSIYQIILNLLMENKEVIIVTAYHLLGKSEKDKICRQMRAELFNLLFQFPKVIANYLPSIRPKSSSATLLMPHPKRRDPSSRKSIRRPSSCTTSSLSSTTRLSGRGH